MLVDYERSASGISVRFGDCRSLDSHAHEVVRSRSERFRWRSCLWVPTMSSGLCDLRIRVLVKQAPSLPWGARSRSWPVIWADGSGGVGGGVLRRIGRRLGGL